MTLTKNQDLESFASYLGLDGIDMDLFYEVYYDMDPDVWEYEINLETD